MYVAFPRSKYYARIRLPARLRPSYGWSFSLAYSTTLVTKTAWDLPGSSTLPFPLVPCSQTPPESPATIAIFGCHHGLPDFRPCRPPDRSHGAQSLHLRYGPSVALSTLSPCRYLREPKTRFSVEWLRSLPRRELHPLEAPGFPWRTEIGLDIGFQNPIHFTSCQHPIKQPQCVVCTATRSKAIRAVQKDCLVQHSQQLGQYALYQLVFEAGHGRT